MQIKNYHIILLLLAFSISQSFAQDLPARSTRLVNDYAGLLSKQEINFLERKLVNYNDTTSTQIAVLIVNDLNGYDIVDYAQRVGQAWGVGQKGKENGVIIVLKPKTATAKGEVNIDVGYGLEPIIPDATAKRIVEKEMIPHFKNNDYVGGLNAATDVIISLAAGHFSADEYNKGSDGNGAGFLVPIIVMIIVFSIINRRRRGTYSTSGKGSSLPFWTALWLGSTMGRSHGGSWSNFHSGSGGFGSGGGSFGGFGGGSFGGGGASGSW
jgi:uncharacterized protein